MAKRNAKPAPAIETETPAPAPVLETPAPVSETETETPAPVSETETETPAPVSETETQETETQETETPAPQGETALTVTGIRGGRIAPLQNDVTTILQGGPRSVASMATQLGVTERDIRLAIDRARLKGWAIRRVSKGVFGF